jgi:hypothetical protein
MRNLRIDLEGGQGHRTRRIRWAALDSLTEWTLSSRWARQKMLDVKWAEDDKLTQERVRNIQATAAQNKAKAHTNGATPAHPVVPDQLVHATGPESPLPMKSLAGERFDPPRALVEAARQFAGLNREIEGKIKELEAMGVHVDREKMAKAVSMPADPRLTAVAEAMPYIEQLERQVSRLTNQNDDYRAKVANQPQIQADISRLRNANERLVGENTARASNCPTGARCR